MGARKIEANLLAHIDDSLKNNPLAQQIIREKDRSLARALLVEAAKSQIGVREQGGNNRGKIVSMYQDTMSRPSAQAWCMDFDQSMTAYVEVKLGIVSPIYASEGCDQVFVNTPKIYRVSGLPLPGAWVIWGHYDAKGRYKGGHTGIVCATDGGIFFAVEGNTTGGLGEHDRVIRDGGGVYYTKRSFKGDGNMKVRGFIKPF